MHAGRVADAACKFAHAKQRLTSCGAAHATGSGGRMLSGAMRADACFHAGTPLFPDFQSV
jgi:hypothetical protein